MQEFIETSHSLAYKLSTDYAVHNIGFEDCAPGYSYGPRVCPYHILHFIRKGQGTLFISQLALPVHAGEAFLIPADRIASYQASETDPWSYAWVGFLGTRANRLCDQLMTSTPENYVLHNLDTQKYWDMIREEASHTEPTISNFFRVNGKLLTIFSELTADVGKLDEAKEQISLAAEIRYYLEMKFSEKFQMADVAKVFGIHPNYMTRIFREKYGIAPKQFLLQMKMQKACRLLSTTGLSIAMISDTLGFDDQLAFSKTFHKMQGYSPTEYRIRHQAMPS